MIFSTQDFKCPVSVKAVVGELVKPSKITSENFKKEQGFKAILKTSNACSLCAFKPLA